jgi:hypothetical protein
MGQRQVTSDESHFGHSVHAARSIRGWWRAEGCRLYLRARRLPITAGGPNHPSVASKSG